MTHTARCRLPKKPSALILLALDDLAKAERSPRYRVDMGTYHGGSENLPQYDPATCKVTRPKAAPCVVCLAGSVMAFSLNVPPEIDVEPNPSPAKDTHGRK